MIGKYVAKWILLPKSFRLSYLTPPLPLLVFAVQRDEDRELVGKIIHLRKYQRDQNSIAIILEHQSVNNVKKLLLRLRHVCQQWVEGKLLRNVDLLIHLTLADPIPCGQPDL